MIGSAQMLIGALGLATLAACRSGAPGPRGASLFDAPVVMPTSKDGWRGSGTFHHHLSRAGNVFFAGQPDRAALDDASANNVTTIINTRTDPEIAPDRLGFDEPGVVRSLGLGYMPIPFAGDALGIEHADALARALEGVPADRCALIHCGSSNRVGALWALYLARHRGVPVDEAIEHGRGAGLRSGELESRVRSLVR